LSEALDQLRALIVVSQAINSTLELQAVLDAILAHACRLANAWGGAIYTFDEVTEEFALAATFGMSEELIKAIKDAHPRLHDNSPVGRSALGRSVVEISDLSAEPKDWSRDLLRAHCWRCLCCARTGSLAR
jgi:hypothetical protein